MKKQIRITLTDGRIYGIDAEKVAEDYAKTHDDDPDTTYQENFDHCFGDNETLEDWLFNNMNWYELDPVLIQHFLEPLEDCEILEVEVKKINV